jgi:spore coat polysaccharide biosynthesis protein SpsF
MGSTRLPGKVLADLAGRPMLAQQLRRMRDATTLDEIVLATSVSSRDDALVAFAEHAGIRCVRGSEDDVLSRYLLAAREARADLIVRVTADCPLIDGAVIDRVVGAATDEHDACDYASNTIHRTYPRGLDTEAMHRDVLERIARLARSTPAREHVTWFLHRERPEIFLTRDVTNEHDDSDLRWTVDTTDDLALVRGVYELCGLGEGSLPYVELVSRVRAAPELMRLNAHVAQKTR